MDKTYRASRKSPSALASPDKLSLVVTLDGSGVSYSQGIIAKRSEMVPYNKINSVNIQQGPLEATLGYGTVIIATGNDVEPITLDDIESPADLRDDIISMMNQSNQPAAAPQPAPQPPQASQPQPAPSTPDQTPQAPAPAADDAFPLPSAGETPDQGPAPAQTAAPAQTPEEEIEKLASLMQQGIITQAEFDAKKKQLLGL